MSFLSRERSVDSGAPIELYFIQIGLRNWYYTSARYPIVYQTRTYEPVALKRSALEQGAEYGKSSVSLTAFGQLPVATEFLANPPEGIAILTIFRYHDGDAEYATYWSGRVVDARFSGSETSLKAESVYTALQGQGRRKTYSTQCNWTLYKIGCYVNDQAWKSTGVLTGIVGITATSPAFGNQPSGFYTGGKLVVWVNGDPYNRRIDAHTGAQAALNAPVPGLVAGGDIEVYPGCDHSYEMCKTRFNNYLNYGGFPWKPLKDPFSGSAAF